MKWNIKTKLVVMGVSAIAAMGILVWLFFSTSDKVHAADAVVEKELQHLDALVSLRMAGKELVLAAMDSIVDQLEGTILKERREVMQASLGLFESENARLMEAAQEAGEMGKVADGNALAAQIVETVKLLKQASMVDLETALRTRDDAELERLDTVIDEAGERLDKDLAALQAASASELRDAMDGVDAEVQGSTDLALTVFIFGLFIMSGVMGYLGFSITKPISRLTRVMGDLAGGKLDVEIDDMGRRDEVGEMAEAVQVFKDNANREAAPGRRTGRRGPARRGRKTPDHERDGGPLRAFGQGSRGRRFIVGDRDAGDCPADVGDGGRNQPPVGQCGDVLRTGHQQCPDGRGDGGRAFRVDFRDRPPGHAVGQDRPERGAGGRGNQRDGKRLGRSGEPRSARW